MQVDTALKGAVYHHHSGHALWKLDERLLHFNGLDDLWEQQCGWRPHDILFLSKHAAQSGTPSLSVHPIGVPWVREARVRDSVK
jgi:D-tyrosyl-tRNA(Tyr) deacylase